MTVRCITCIVQIMSELGEEPLSPRFSSAPASRLEKVDFTDSNRRGLKLRKVKAEKVKKSPHLSLIPAVGSESRALPDLYLQDEVSVRIIRRSDPLARARLVAE